MNNYQGRAEWALRFLTTNVYRFVESTMQNAIIKDVVSGPVQILRRLLRVLRQRRDLLSVDPKVVKAEMTLAELHCILLLKKENHTLTRDDEWWLEKSKQYHGKHQLDLDAIKGAIAFSRLTDQPYVSPFTGDNLDAAIAFHAKKILDQEAK